MIKTSETIEFQYNLNPGKDIARFNNLPEKTQEDIEQHIVQVIYESFITPGDHDYITARLLAQKGLPRGFYWAAAQATEKYLKAFILSRGHSVKKDATGKSIPGHSIKLLLDEARKIDKSITLINPAPHPKINIDTESRKYLKTFTLEKFINDIEIHGHTDNRYNSFGIEYNTGHLFALDSLTFSLRGKITAPPITHSLEKIEANLICIFEDNNPWFCSEPDRNHSQIPSKDFPIKQTLNSTRLDFLIKNKDKDTYRLALEWLNCKMQTPKKVQDIFKK